MRPRYPGVGPILIRLFLAVLLAGMVSEAQAQIYLQNWEGGTGAWSSKWGPSDPLDLVPDAAAPSPDTVQRITRLDLAGNYYSPHIAVTPGSTVCVAGWVKWVSGGWPFIGLDRYVDGGTGYLGEIWLIGMPGYGDLTPVPVVDGWHWYAKTFIVPADTTFVRMKNELWVSAGRGGDPLGYFDDLAIYSGQCGTQPPGPGQAGAPATRGVDRFEATGSMAIRRVYPTVARLLDGRVLVVGGHEGSRIPTEAEIYDPDTGTFSLTGSAAVGRMGASAFVLAGGAVLVCGGADGVRSRSDCEVFNPATGQFTPGPSMIEPRRFHAATELSDGRVLITGGYVGGADGAPMNSAEIYDPETCSFQALPYMHFGRAQHAAARLHDGRVLLAGGYGGGAGWGEVFDPATNTFYMVANTMTSGRTSIDAVTLPDGRVLVASGYNGNHTTSSDIYDPATNSFRRTADTTDWRTSHAAVLLPDGRALVAGGEYGRLTTDYYDHVTETFTRGPDMVVSRYRTDAVLLEDGRVLLAGGHIDGAGNITNTAETFVSRSSHVVASGPIRIGLRSTVTTYAYDGSGTPVAGVAVTLSATGSGNSFARTSGLTDQQGRFVTTFESSVAEMKTITASVGALTLTTVLAVDPAVAAACFACPDEPAGVTAGGPLTFCEGGAVTLTAAPGPAWLWSTGESTQSIVVVRSGSYSVRVTESNGCTATSLPVSVTVMPRPAQPTIVPSGPTAFCSGGSVVLTATPAAEGYLWSTGESGASITVSAAGTYSVVAVGELGCESATSGAVTVRIDPNPPLPTIGAALEQGRTVLTSSPAASYLWSTGQTTQSIAVTSDGTYSVRVSNEWGCVASSSADVLIAGGHVTGGGWIDSPHGAVSDDPGHTGKASFGFVARYNGDSRIPSGNLELRVAGVTFKSSSHEWLVVSGQLAQVRGVGTINGSGEHAFLATVADGGSGGGADRFRIKIWNRATGAIVYDNRRGSSDDLRVSDTQLLGGGNVSIHRD